MTTIQLECNDIQNFLDMAINQFNLKIKVIDDIKFPNISDKKSRCDKIDKELKNFKTVDANAGDELRKNLIFGRLGTTQQTNYFIVKRNRPLLA